MRIFILSTLLVTLSSCTLPFGNKEVTTSGEAPMDQATTVVEKVVGNNTLVTLNYTLRDASNNAILETTLASVAQANGLFQTGATYQPFQVMIGSNSVIPGFENGLIGLKKGEKKTIRVSPEQGYGTGARIQEVPKYQIAPVFTMKQPVSLLGKTVTQTIEKAQLAEEMKTAQLGQSITGANGAVAKVTNVTESSITLEIENIDNPFYGKDIKVGATAENEGASYKILAKDDTEVTLEVTNKQSPFYNKTFAPGESFPLPQGGKINIIAVGEENVTIGEEHPMMGKTLEFEIEVVDIQ